MFVVFFDWSWGMILEGFWDEEEKESSVKIVNDIYNFILILVWKGMCDLVICRSEMDLLECLVLF